MYDLYATYISDVDAYYSKQGVGSYLSAALTGRGRHGSCPHHEAFLKDVERTISKLAAKGISAEFAEELLRFMLLTDHAEPEHPAFIPLETAEGLVLPLLPFLREGTLNDLTACYRKKLRKGLGLPCQRNVLKGMKAALRSSTDHKPTC